MADFGVLLEAERRGILPPDRQAVLNEARSRGLVPDVSHETMGSGPAPIPGVSGARFTASGATMPPDPTMADVAKRADDIVRGVAEGATFGFADEIAAFGDTMASGGEYEKNLEAQRARDAASNQALRLGGNIGGALMTGRAIPAPQTMGQAIGGGAGLGTVAGFGAGEGGFESRATEALKSGALGAGLGGALQGLGRVISPQSSQATQDLLEAGVKPTPGQALGGGLGRAEEKLVSAPFLGSAITESRKKALESFNRAVINKALAPANLKVADDIPVDGRQAYNAAADALSGAYDDVVGKIPTARFDQPFVQQMNQALSEAKTNLTADGLRTFQNQIKKVFNPVAMKSGQVKGEDLHTFISDLGKKARGYASSSTQAEREVGEALVGLKDVFDDLLMRSTTPDNAARLRDIRRAYAQFMPVENAVSRVGATSGVFTPEALRSAVRATDQSLRKRQFARGGALMQEMAEQGVDILGREVPNSGTAERVLTNAMLGGAALVEPTALALGGASLAASAPYRYTPLQNMMLQAVAGRQGPAFQGVGQAVSGLAPAASLMAPAASTSLLGP